MADGWVRHASE